MILSLTSNKSFFCQRKEGGWEIYKMVRNKGVLLNGAGNPWPTIQTTLEATHFRGKS